MQPFPQDQQPGGSDSTGSRPVAAATPSGGALDLTVLDTLAERPPHEHAAVYDQVHAQLQNALSQIDDA